MLMGKAVWKNENRSELRENKNDLACDFHIYYLYDSFCGKGSQCFLHAYVNLNIFFMTMSKNTEDIKSMRDFYLYILVIW